MAEIYNWAQTEAMEFINDKVDSEVWNGAGNDTNAKKKIYGLKSQATAFEKVATYEKANVGDVVIDAIAQAKKNGFVANVAIVGFGTEAELKAVKDAKGVKTTAEAHELNTGLRGFEWVNFPTILQNKKGDKFVRITTNSNTKFDTTYYANGIKVNKEDIEQYLPKSSRGDMPVVMNINMDNINYIH
jgi:hypothetical protein